MLMCVQLFMSDTEPRWHLPIFVSKLNRIESQKRFCLHVPPSTIWVLHRCVHVMRVAVGNFILWARVVGVQPKTSGKIRYLFRLKSSQNSALSYFTYLDVGNKILASPILASPKWWSSNFVTLCTLKAALLFVNAPRSVRSEYVTNSPGLELKLAHLLSHARRKVMRE